MSLKKLKAIHYTFLRMQDIALLDFGTWNTRNTIKNANSLYISFFLLSKYKELSILQKLTNK